MTQRMSRPSGRCRQLIRCLKLIRDQAWKSRMTGITLRRLAEQHQVSTRTIRRDLQALREAGYGECRWTEYDLPADRVG